MKHTKLLLSVAVALLVGLISAGAYTSLGHSVFQASLPVSTPAPTPLPLDLQVFTPQENSTYGTYSGPLNLTADEAAHETTYSLELPLNITANNSTAQITYSLDGTGNVTLGETSTLSLTYGVHNLAVYAFDSQGNVGEARNVTFTVGQGYLPFVSITEAQVQQAIGYFEGRGLTIQVLDESKLQWQDFGSLLYGGSVDLTSKEALADFAVSHGINIIHEERYSNIVCFTANYYNNSWLPIVYTYSATVAG